jgi:hypothetical protein
MDARPNIRNTGGQAYYAPFVPDDSSSDSGSSQEDDSLYTTTDTGSDIETGDATTNIAFRAIVNRPAPTDTLVIPPPQLPLARMLAGSTGAAGATGTSSTAPLYSQTRTAGGLDFAYLQDTATLASIPQAPAKYTQARKTTLWLVESAWRNTTIYQQPTEFVLHTPCTFRNIVEISLQEIKLLSTFSYFQHAKGNTSIRVAEQGRDPIDISIREGTYSLEDLQTELQRQMNLPPIFHHFPGGFQEFFVLFQQTGDISLTFAQPGDSFYDVLTDTFLDTPTLTDIVGRYFSTQVSNIMGSNIQFVTLDMAMTAYYYPVLKEMVARPAEIAKLQDAAGAALSDTLAQHILNAFSGLDPPDATVLDIVRANIAALDTYREQNTFLNKLVNRYSLTILDHVNRLQIAATGLSTSISNLINTEITRAFTSQLASLGAGGAIVSTDEFVLDETLAQQQVAVVTDMYDYMQLQFQQILGVDVSTFAPVYFTDRANPVHIVNGQTAVNVASTLTAARLADPSSLMVTEPPAPSSVTAFWPDLPATYSVMSINLGDLSSGYMDISMRVSAGQYTVLAFTNDIRRDLAIQTLPTSTATALAYVSVTTAMGDDPMDVAGTYTRIAADYFQNAATSAWRTTVADMRSVASVQTIDPVTSELYYYFSVPLLSTTIASPPLLYNVNLRLTPCATTTTASSDTSGLLQEPLRISVYHDRSAFMADIRAGNGSEVAKHPILQSTLAAGTPDARIALPVVENDSYFVLVRSHALSTLTACHYRLYLWPTYVQDTLSSASASSNVQTLARSTSRSSTAIERYLYPKTVAQWSPHETPVTAFARDDVLLSEPALGYDMNGVSNDLADYYLGKDAATSYRLDPFSGHVFCFLTAYNAIGRTYFAPNSRNLIMNARSNAQQLTRYSFVSVATALPWTKMLNAAADYIQHDSGPATGWRIAAPYDAVLPTAWHALPTDCTTVGLLFGLPDSKVVRPERITLRSALVPNLTTNASLTTDDPNKQIAAVCIYRYEDVDGVAATALRMDNALCTLWRSRTVYYMNDRTTLTETTIDSATFLRTTPVSQIPGPSDAGAQTFADGCYMFFDRATDQFTTTGLYSREQPSSSTFPAYSMYAIVAFTASGLVAPIRFALGTTAATAQYATASTWIPGSVSVPAQPVYNNSGTLDLGSTSDPFALACNFEYSVTHNSFDRMQAVEEFLSTPGYADTRLFVFDDPESLDLATEYFGAEVDGDYLYTDDDGGYYQYSYIPNNTYQGDGQGYMVAVRGYAPTEDFTTVVRITGSTKVTFGTHTLTDMVSSISNIAALSTTGMDATYVTTMRNFGSKFNVNRTFGGEVLNSYAGVTVSTATFNEYLSTYLLHYSAATALTTAINTSFDTVDSNMNTFVQNYFGDILPSTYWDRVVFNDPIPFQLQFASALQPQYADLDRKWGLGWSLGFPKADTEYGIVHAGTALFQILDDVIYLQMDQAQGMNTISTGAPEDENSGSNGSGKTDSYFAKILLNSYGDYAQSFVHAPKEFRPPIGQITKAHFRLVDAAGNVLDNEDCEWTGTISITELVMRPNENNGIETTVVSTIT